MLHLLLQYTVLGVDVDLIEEKCNFRPATALVSALCIGELVGSEEMFSFVATCC